MLAPGFWLEQPASLPHGGRHEGFEGMAAMGAIFAQHWTRTIGEADLCGSGATAMQLTTQTWTAKATGRSVTVDVVERIRVDRGRVTDIRVFPQDTAALLATLEP